MISYSRRDFTGSLSCFDHRVVAKREDTDWRLLEREKAKGNTGPSSPG